jgi:hypothetical protein
MPGAPGREDGEHVEVAADRATYPRRTPDPDPDQPHRPERGAGRLPDGRPLAAGELLQVRLGALDLDALDSHADLAHAIDTAVIQADRRGNGGKATVDPAANNNPGGAQSNLDAAKQASRDTPTHLSLGQVRSSSRLLETERNY